MTIAGWIFFVVWMLTLSVVLSVVIYRYRTRKKKINFTGEFNQLALSLGLSRDDIKELKHILKEQKINKPYLIFTSSLQMETMVNRAISSLENLNISDKDRESRVIKIFEIRRKISNHFLEMNVGLKSTQEIEVDQPITLKLQGVGKFYSTVLVNDRKNLICSIPDIKDPFSVPWKDKNVEIYFWRARDAGYVFNSVIENVVYNDKMKALLIAHQPSLKRVQRREYPRRSARINAKFFKFSISTGKDGKSVLLLGGTHFGVITDLSVGGLSMVSDDFLEIGNSVKVQFDLNEVSLDVYGKIIKLFRRKNFYVMHIKIVRLDNLAKNLIYRYVYRYLDEG